MITVWTQSIAAGKCSNETDSQGTERDGCWSSTHSLLFSFCSVWEPSLGTEPPTLFFSQSFRETPSRIHLQMCSLDDSKSRQVCSED